MFRHSQSIKSRRIHNSINILHIDGRLVNDPGKIQQAFISFYSDLRCCNMKSRKRVIQIINSGPTVTDHMRSSLNLYFSKEDIKGAIWSIPDDKAPGLDGYNIKFYKSAWSIIGDDITSAVQDFFRSGKMLKAWNNRVVSLLPKTSCPTTPSDFRPMACCHTIYKCISKLICSRLSHIISQNQRAFVCGRSIIHNILLCQDIIRHYSRKNCSPSCLIKVDLRKAYDTMDWFFIKDMLVALGFPSHFVKIVFTCLSTSTFSLILNGTPLESLKAKRGLRQGDPMSPLLFVIGMKYLSRLLQCASLDPAFKIHPRCAPLKLTHLSLADDLMLFSKGDVHSISILYKGLDLFA